MAPQLVSLTTCPPQYASLPRVRISKPSMWVTRYSTVSSLSFSTSPLRYAAFCCSSSATSYVESNLPSSAKIFVKGLPHSTSEGRLMKVFSEFGEVNLGNNKSYLGGWHGFRAGYLGSNFCCRGIHAMITMNGISFFDSLNLLRTFNFIFMAVQLPIDEESGQSLGFAFIWFVKEESAQLAVQEMNGKFFDGRFIYVAIAKPGSSKNWKRTTAYKF